VPGVDQDASFFEHQGVSEVFRTLTFELRVVAVEENPELSSAPIIQWEGEMAHGIAKTRGTAMLMDDGNVHWSFVRPFVLSCADNSHIHVVLWTRR
jgi:hypothetical protein